jgi:integrase/recombinase XerD
MEIITQTQGTILLEDLIYTWMEAFIIDRKARGLAEGTLRFYKQKLKLFYDYCDAQLVSTINQITPTIIRQFLLYLEETDHNPGGRHAAYRALRAFLYWYEDEVEPDNWKNPIRKVKPPRVPVEILDPIPIVDIDKMIASCEKGTLLGERDTAILLCLLDTGVRASELLGMDIVDTNLILGDALIRQGKGRKPRFVHICKRTRKAIRSYIRQRKDTQQALWITHPRFGPNRLSYDGLRSILVRLAGNAGVNQPTLHDFRRSFCISMLRSGVDVFTLAKLMGHTSIAVLQRYLKQTMDDTKEAHRRASPVEGYQL